MLASTSNSIALSGQYGAVSTFPAASENTPVSLWLTGAVFKNSVRLSAAELCAELEMARQLGLLIQFCASLNGFFSIVWRQTSGWILISDKVRSRPLFWRAASALPDRAIISDSAYQLLHANSTPNPVSVEEFLHTGYVTGADTLYSDISQVEAAQMVELNTAGECIGTQNYYQFLAPGFTHTTKASAEAGFWLKQLDDKMTAVTTRLIDYANGRQIVLPLSGGYDSRILAVYLKQSGYPNICCFTFGSKNSPEVQTSQQVAQALGFSWHHVLYSKPMWRQLSAQDEFEEYLQFMHGAVSVPNLQVYPALKQLLAQGVILPDALMVPGHTGDFISGGHLPVKVLQSFDQLYRSVVARHYELSPDALSAALTAKLRQQLQHFEQAASGTHSLCSIAEGWNWKERQAKFIVNSNRYYDFFKLDWWMPLWDSEMVDLWLNVPYELRKSKSLWIRFVDQQMLQTTGQQITGNAADSHSKWKKGEKLFNYFTDTNSVYALMPFSRWLTYRLKLSRKPPFLFSFLAERQIKQMKR